VRILRFVSVGLLGLLCVGARADTFQLNDGQAVTGEIVATSANDAGVQIRVEEGKYQLVPWSNFSQDDLKKFKENPKFAAFVEPLIEMSAEERTKRAEVVIKPVNRIDRPPAHSLFGAMFSSSVGIFLMLLLYAANIYAAFEISIFRAQPAILVCGVAAVAPLIGPIIFLCLPTRPQTAAEEEAEAAAHAPAVIQPFAVPNQPGAPGASEHPHPAEAGGLRLAAEPAGAFGSSAAHPAIPQAQVFQRGAYTFNRRFFETRFPGFFGVIRREADKDMVLAVKAARGQYTATRISRIAANELHFQVQTGSASEEIMIPFSEIQEIQLKHKDAP
jgi:hypothetical protein